MGRKFGEEVWGGDGRGWGGSGEEVEVELNGMEWKR